MREFYRVGFYTENYEIDLEDIFFKARGNALDFLWQQYLNHLTGNETEEEIDEVRQELNVFDEISSIGRVYTEHFED